MALAQLPAVLARRRGCTQLRAWTAIYSAVLALAFLFLVRDTGSWKVRLLACSILSVLQSFNATISTPLNIKPGVPNGVDANEQDIGQSIAHLVIASALSVLLAAVRALVGAWV